MVYQCIITRNLEVRQVWFMNFDELIVGFKRNALREKVVKKYSPDAMRSIKTYNKYNGNIETKFYCSKYPLQ